MADLANLTNRGVFVLNPAPTTATATVGATGLGRSGTTMLARILSDLGLFMGEKLTPQSHEDKHFQVLIKARDFAGFEALCRKRDAAFSLWGFKCPGLRNDLAKLAALMRNPRIIIIFRDPLAISIRNNIAHDASVLEGVSQALKGYTKLLDSVSQLSCPVLMVSYEKAVADPITAVRAIADFAGLSRDNVEMAAKGVVNGDLRYLAANG